jgi:hypothetical protein
MSETAWNLAELRTHVSTQCCGGTRALELIRSIDRSDSIFRYHMATARDALKGIINHEEPQGPENWMFVLGGSERQGDFDYAKIVSEAHLIGCVYTARSLLEVFAQLVNCIVLEGSIPAGECTLRKVAARLSAGALKGKLEELLASYWFAYVAAFVNTVKHRQLVQHQISISFVENVVGIMIGSFEYDDVTYQAYWANEFLQGVISVKNQVIGAGRVLNRICGAA